MIDKKLFIKIFSELLKEAGFIRKGQSWYWAGKDALIVFNLQRVGNFYNQYFINFGIWLKAFGIIEFPPFNRCHLYYRIERFFPQQRELILNSCSLEVSNLQLINEFSELMKEQIITLAKELTNEQNLRKLMLQGFLDKGLGRTEAREYLSNP